MFGFKVDKNKIIEKYEKNIERFEDSINELTEEYIYFRRETLEMNGIIITIHREKEDGKTEVITVDKKDYEKYQKTLDLKEDLDINYISKNSPNILFQLNAMIGLSQEIVRLVDGKSYIERGYEITYKEPLENDWYYIESE